MIHKAYMPVNKIFIADRASQVEQEDLKKLCLSTKCGKNCNF